MEGISHEAVSLAGALKLAKLIVLFDDNDICIDGPTNMAVIDDQPARFAASGWHVQSIDGHDKDAVATAIEAAQADDRPSMIACKTVIGRGAPTRKALRQLTVRLWGTKRSHLPAKPWAGRICHLKYPKTCCPPGVKLVRVVVIPARSGPNGLQVWVKISSVLLLAD